MAAACRRPRTNVLLLLGSASPRPPAMADAAHAQLPDDPADADQFDAANKSLADALALSFLVLRWVFVLLLVVFLFSGVFTVSQNEVAIRTSFGRIVGTEGSEVLTADGGPYFRWPRPIGEVIKVPTAERTVELYDDFVFAIRNRADESKRLSELTAGATLDPAVDGFLVTGDRNIVHARYEVRYVVQPGDAADFVRNAAGPLDPAGFDTLADNPELLFERPEALIRRAVKEAIVADVASLDIDSFLRNARATPTVPDATPATPDAAPEAPDAPADAGAEADADTAVAGGGEEAAQQEYGIRVSAQRVLDAMNAGITINSVQRTDFTPPPYLRNTFEALNTSLQYQQELISQGNQQRTQILTAAAGRAFPAVLAAIDVYDAADRQQQASPDDAGVAADLDRADAALRDLLAGEPIGTVLPRLAETLPADDPRRDRLLELAAAAPGDTVSGTAFNVIRAAQTEAVEIEKQTQTELELFERLLPDYRRNPEQFKRQLFFATLREVLANEGLALETVKGRPGDTLRIEVGEDADRRALDEQRQIEQRNRQRAGGGGQ